jgi:hypothetical protein
MLFDDVAGMNKLFEDGLKDKREDDHYVYFVNLPTLFWHQDKTAKIDNSYVFFAVLDSAGNIRPQDNLLQVASVPSCKLQRPTVPQTVAYYVDVKDDADIKIEQEIAGDSGAGYMVNEDDMFYDTRGACVPVHRHGYLRFAKSTFDPEREPKLAAEHFAPDEKPSRANYFREEDGVRRVKVVVRIWRQSGP